MSTGITHKKCRPVWSYGQELKMLISKTELNRVNLAIHLYLQLIISFQLVECQVLNVIINMYMMCEADV